MGASEIELVDVTSGKPFPAAPAGNVLASSVPLGWRGIVVEWHRLPPQELPEHYVVGLGLSVSTCKAPIRFGWRHGSGLRERALNPGECHLLTHGDLNTPRWLDTFEAVSLVFDRQVVAALLRDGLPAEKVELVTQRSIHDPTIAGYAEALRSELVADAPNGPLYAEALTIGLALHLLSTYAVARPRLPSPRGKLTSFQLRAVVDHIQSHLAGDLSLVALADKANVSPFHFARLFRATVGLPPRQFVLRQRVQRSFGPLRAGKLALAQIALDCGFHDQPHFTRAFRKLVGTTPARYVARRGRPSD